MMLQNVLKQVGVIEFFYWKVFAGMRGQQVKLRKNVALKKIQFRLLVDMRFWNLRKNRVLEQEGRANCQMELMFIFTFAKSMAILVLL
jgi:hypothetical protein